MFPGTELAYFEVRGSSRKPSADAALAGCNQEGNEKNRK